MDPAVQEWVVYALLALVGAALSIRAVRRRGATTACGKCGSAPSRRADRRHLPVLQ